MKAILIVGIGIVIVLFSLILLNQNNTPNTVLIESDSDIVEYEKEQLRIKEYCHNGARDWAGKQDFEGLSTYEIEVATKEFEDSCIYSANK